VFPVDVKAVAAGISFKGGRAICGGFLLFAKKGWHFAVVSLLPAFFQTTFSRVFRLRHRMDFVCRSGPRPTGVLQNN
jgi:hypothetical protein